MTRKKKNETKDEKKPRFEVKKRPPKEKPNYFQNIPSMRHPLAEILDFPQEAPRQPLEEQPEKFGHSNPETLDTQKESPLDTQRNKSGHPKEKSLDTQTTFQLDTQKEKAGHSTLENLDTQKEKSGHSNAESLDTQTEKIGHPTPESLVTQAPKNRTQAPKSEESLGAQAPKEKEFGHSKTKKWRKYEKSRSTVRVNLHINKEIDRKVRQYCMIDADPKVELKEFYEQAALRFLEFLDTQNIETLGAQAPLDDRRLKMLYKSKPFIINLYLAYNAIFNELSTGNKSWKARWTPRDDAVGVKFNDVDPRIVELGIIQTQTNKGIGEGKIQTFKYYADEIENILLTEIKEETLQTVLEYHRAVWKKLTGGREVSIESDQ